MTIKIERDAILQVCVINNKGTSTPSLISRSNNHDQLRQQPSSSSPSLCHRPLQELKGADRDLLDFIRSYSETAPELEDTDDESTVSSSSCSSSTVGVKGVSFADPIVTDVRWRPRTLRKHVRSLFYTVEQTQRFRQEYREERRLKAQEADSNASSQLSTSSSGEPGETPTWDGFQNQNPALDNNGNNTNGGSSNNRLNANHSSATPPKNHRISRVVVLHRNTRETFIDGEMNDNPQHANTGVGAASKSGAGAGSNSSSSSGPCTDSASVTVSSASSTTTLLYPDQCKMASDDFFDNDSFWSGEITWY